MNRLFKTLLGFAAISLLIALALALQFNRFLQTPVQVGEEGVFFEIRSGLTFRQVANDLADKEIITWPNGFGLYGRLTDKAARIQAGEYQIPAGTTPTQLLDMFVSGDVQLYSFTIIEGWTFRELLQALAADEVVAKTMQYEDWPALLEGLTADASHPEGLFLPETYRFPRGTTDVELLRQAYALMQSTLAGEWAMRAPNLPVTSAYEALILASIIEKETALAAERPRIAGVFVRRLEKRMRLQTDPTVIYGIGTEFNGNLTRRDLRTDTPYNTYTRGGLPPSPIALPGKAAINAALNPASGTEVYFVATGLGDGSHKFSDTKAEHDAAVQDYLRRQRASSTQR